MQSPVFDKITSNDVMGSVGEIHQFENKGTFKGKVRITIEENGSSEVVWEDPNLIVDTGRKILTHLLAEADTSYRVREIRMGTKGHDLTTGNILNPIAPLAGDLTLVDTIDVFAKQIGTGFDYQGFNPLDSSVMFQIVMEKTEANGTTGTTAYTEAGLFAQNGTMFARETFPAIVKNANRKITFQWIILF